MPDINVVANRNTAYSDDMMNMDRIVTTLRARAKKTSKPGPRNRDRKKRI